MIRLMTLLAWMWWRQILNAIAKFLNSDLFVQGYPTAWGNKYHAVVDHYGPTSYSNIGTSSGTGDVINATQYGMGGFDTFSAQFGGYSFSGNYFVKVFTNSTPGVSPIIGGAYNQVVLQWFAASPAFGTVGSEVSNATNLNAEKVRLSFDSI